MKDIKDITPLGQRVLVHFGEKEKVSAGGLILAESAQEKPEICTIVKVGADVENKNLAAGIKVLIQHYAGTDIKIDKSSFTLVNEKDIIAIVED